MSDNQYQHVQLSLKKISKPSSVDELFSEYDTQKESSSDKNDERSRQQNFSYYPKTLPPKHSYNSPNEIRQMNKSAIEELGMFDNPVPNKIFQIYKTLDEIGIRKSNSLEKDRLEYSLSSDNIVLQSENTNLKKTIEQLNHQINYLTDLEQQVKSELVFYKRKVENLQAKKVQYEQSNNQTTLQLQESLQKLSLQQKRVEELEKLMNEQNVKINYYQTERKRGNEKGEFRVKQLEDQMKKLDQVYRNKIENQKKSYQKELITIRKSFQQAKIVGQYQIGILLAKLHKKDEEIIAMKSKLNQQFGKISTYISENMTHSNSKDQNIDQKIDKIENRFINRFYLFSKMIDKRLYRSCQKDNKLLCHEKVTQSFFSSLKRQGDSDNIFNHRINRNLNQSKSNCIGYC